MSRQQARVAQDGQVRKTVLYVTVWFVAGVAAVGLASAGVSMVTRQVTGSRPAPLSAGQVREELAAGEIETDGTTTTTSAPARSSTTVAASPSTTVTGGPATTAPSSPSSGPGPSSAAAATTTTAPPPPPATTTRTYDLVGGTATLRFSPNGVTVVVATPKAGFSVDVGASHDGGARVEFESVKFDHRSRVDAWWDGGPQDEVREED